MMKKILTACLMAVLCQGAFADDSRWLYVDTAKDKSFIAFIDATRSTSDSIWVKYKLIKENEFGVDHMLIRYAVSCRYNQYAMMQQAGYTEQGTVIYTEDIPPDEAQFTEPAPNSINETLILVACSPDAAAHMMRLNQVAEQRLPKLQKIIAQLADWQEKMERNEPNTYAGLKPALLAYMRDSVYFNLPPEQWLPAMQTEYQRLKRQSSTPQETPLSPINRR